MENKAFNHYKKNLEHYFFVDQYKSIVAAKHKDYGEILIELFPDSTIKVFIPEILYIEKVRNLNVKPHGNR